MEHQSVKKRSSIIFITLSIAAALFTSCSFHKEAATPNFKGDISKGYSVDTFNSEINTSQHLLVSLNDKITMIPHLQKAVLHDTVTQKFRPYLLPTPDTDIIILKDSVYDIKRNPEIAKKYLNNTIILTSISIIYMVIAWTWVFFSALLISILFITAIYGSLAGMVLLFALSLFTIFFLTPILTTILGTVLFMYILSSVFGGIQFYKYLKNGSIKELGKILSSIFFAIPGLVLISGILYFLFFHLSVFIADPLYAILLVGASALIYGTTFFTALVIDIAIIIVLSLITVIIGVLSLGYLIYWLEKLYSILVKSATFITKMISKKSKKFYIKLKTWLIEHYEKNEIQKGI